MWYVARTVVLIITSTVFLTGTGMLSACGTADMTESNSGALDDSVPATVPMEILTMAASQDAAELTRLGDLLADEATLLKWDSESDYDELDPRSLNLAKVLKALSENSTESAERQLAGLTTSPLYQNQDARVLLLIEAMGNLEHVDEQVVSYWRIHSAAGSIFTVVVVDAAAHQGGSESARVVGEILLNPSYTDYDKVAWLRRSLVPNRNQIGLLSEAGVWLSEETLSPAVRAALIEALFDYQPEEWYPPGVFYPPPEPPDYSSEALSIRTALARGLVDSGTLDDDLLKIVREAADQ
jgi:hypothetical protein